MYAEVAAVFVVEEPCSGLDCWSWTTILINTTIVCFHMVLVYCVMLQLA